MPGKTQNFYGDLTPFLAKSDGGKWFRKKYFEIQLWPSEIPPNLPGQFSLPGQIFFALGSSNSEGHHGILRQFSLLNALFSIFQKKN